MKKILAIIAIAILLLVIIIKFEDDNNFKNKSNLYRVEKNKVNFTLFFLCIKKENWSKVII